MKSSKSDSKYFILNNDLKVVEVDLAKYLEDNFRKKYMLHITTFPGAQVITVFVGIGADAPIFQTRVICENHPLHQIEQKTNTAEEAHNKHTEMCKSIRR